MVHGAPSCSPPRSALPACHSWCITPRAPWPPFYAAQAIAADPRNPLAKFERAAVLMAEERHREAIAELHALKVGRSASCL